MLATLSLCDPTVLPNDIRAIIMLASVQAKTDAAIQRKIANRTSVQRIAALMLVGFEPNQCMLLPGAVSCNL
eukprot:6214841-Pleurochrysis_carterae.AAC.2